MTAKDSTSSLPALELAAVSREFPTYDDAEMLLDCFTKTIDASYRMLHIPTTWQSLREFYSDLKNGRLASATQVLSSSVSLQVAPSGRPLRLRNSMIAQRTSRYPGL
jgi:hypothetical protein